MKKQEFIDVQVTVEPVTGSLSDPRQRALAIRQEKGSEGIFAAPINPEMRGRRPSGVVFRPEQEVPPEMRGVPIEEAPLIAVSKRSAKSVAEELTSLPVQVREKNGRCYIEVVFPIRRLEFEGNTWFHALLSLKHFLSTRGQ